jgi:hypothetical protein
MPDGQEVMMSEPSYVGEGAEHGLDEDYWNELPDEAQEEIRAQARAQAEYDEQEELRARAEGIDLDPSH